MECPSCGAETREGSKFCPSCGARFKPPVEEKTEEEKPEPALTATVKEQEEKKEVVKKARKTEPVKVERKSPESTGPPHERKKKTTRWHLAVVVLVIIALLGTGLGYYFIWHRDGGASEEEAFGFETREYEVKVEIPEGTPLDLAQTKIVYGIDGETQIENAEGNTAQAKVSMNDPATGLMTLQDENTGEDILYAIFPKDERHLVDYIPDITTESTAQALVLMQVGVANSDPIVARMTLELLKELPEVQELSKYIEDRLMDGLTDISLDDDNEFSEQITQAYLAFLELLAKAKSDIGQDNGNLEMKMQETAFHIGNTENTEMVACIKGFGDSTQVIQAELDKDDDVYIGADTGKTVEMNNERIETNCGIDVEMTFDPETMTGHFEFTNHYHWPGVAVISRGKDIGPARDAEYLCYYIDPVPFEVATVSGAIINTVFSTGHYLADVLKGDFDSLEVYFEDVFGDMNETFSISECDYTFSEYGDYSLLIYVPGWGCKESVAHPFEDFDWSVLGTVEQDVYPDLVYETTTYLYKIGEEFLEILKIIVDIKDLGYKGHRDYSKSEDLYKVVVLKIIASCGEKLNDLRVSFQNNDSLGIIKSFFEISLTVAKDTRFWEFLCRHFFVDVLPDILSKKLSDKMIHLVTKATKLVPSSILKVLAIADVIAAVIGEACRLYLWRSEGKGFGPKDEFTFTLDGSEAPSALATGSDTVFVVDVSGSMGDYMGGETKLYYAQAAARDLVGTIQNEAVTGGVNHTVGLATFSDNAQINSKLSSNYSTVDSVINSLEPLNSTNMEDGIYKGVDVLGSSQGNRQKIIVLLSDGLPNQGASSQEDLLAGAVEAARARGITINTVGFGDDCDEDLLRGIASYTGGMYAFASDYFTLSSGYVKIRHEAMGKLVFEEQGSMSSTSGVKRKTFQVTEDSGELNGTMNWSGASVLDFRLYDPKGRLVDSSYPGASLFKDSNPMQFIIRNPIKGEWVLEIEVGGASSALPGKQLAAASMGGVGVFFPLVYAQEEEYEEEETGDTEYQIVVSTRGVKDDVTTYPLVLLVIFVTSLILGLFFFLLFNRRITPSISKR